MMKGIIISLFCALALALGEDEIELNAIGCPVDPTIHKVIEHDTYCNQFYSCVGGSLIELRCPVGLVFNAEEEVCDWPINVDCKGKGINENEPESEEDKEEENNPAGNSDPSQAPAICGAAGSDGILVAHEYCDKFYLCQGGLPITLQCPDDLRYNYNIGVCDWAVNVECGDRPISEKPEEVEEAKSRVDRVMIAQPTVEEICAADTKNEVLLPHKTCNRFYMCSFGTPVAFNCPEGLVYNIQDHICDWQSNVQCGDRIIVIDSKVEEDKIEDNEEGVVGNGHSDPSQATAICSADESDSILIAHENCNQFYKCWQGVPVALDCPLNLLYNAPLEICDWPLNVDCGSRYKSSRKF